MPPAPAWDTPPGHISTTPPPRCASPARRARPPAFPSSYPAPGSCRRPNCAVHTDRVPSPRFRRAPPPPDRATPAPPGSPRTAAPGFSTPLHPCLSCSPNPAAFVAPPKAARAHQAPAHTNPAPLGPLGCPSGAHPPPPRPRTDPYSPRRSSAAAELLRYSPFNPCFPAYYRLYAGQYRNDLRAKSHPGRGALTLF